MSLIKKEAVTLETKWTFQQCVIMKSDTGQLLARVVFRQEIAGLPPVEKVLTYRDEAFDKWADEFNTWTYLYQEAAKDLGLVSPKADSMEEEFKNKKEEVKDEPKNDIGTGI